jgi:hypothetical protein
MYTIYNFQKNSNKYNEIFFHIDNVLNVEFI